jgi:hypothetical protein
MASWSNEKVFLQLNYVEKETVHSIEVSLKISTNKLQERNQSDFFKITRPYPKLDLNIK